MKAKFWKALGAVAVKIWANRLSLVLVLLVISMAVTSSAIRGRNPNSVSDLHTVAGVATNQTGVGMMTAKVVAVLGLVIALLYGGMFGLRRLSGRSAPGGLSQGGIKVLCRQQIAPRKAIYVISVVNKAMVIGVTDSQISHLSDLSEEEVSELISKQARSNPFKRSLLSALGMQEKSKA